MAEIPEQVYLDAARAFRVAVESAYAAGYGRGRDDEAAGLDLPAWAAPEPQPATPATPATINQDTPAAPDAGTEPDGPAEAITGALGELVRRAKHLRMLDRPAERVSIEWLINEAHDIAKAAGATDATF